MSPKTIAPLSCFEKVLAGSVSRRVRYNLEGLELVVQKAQRGARRMLHGGHSSFELPPLLEAGLRAQPTCDDVGNCANCTHVVAAGRFNTHLPTLPESFDGIWLLPPLARFTAFADS